MRYSTAPAYDPRSGMYRGKGNGSKGKSIPKSGAIKTVGQYKIHKRNGSASESGIEARKAAKGEANGDPRKKAR
jgi:hypothetical protein